MLSIFNRVWLARRYGKWYCRCNCYGWHFSCCCCCLYSIYKLLSIISCERWQWCCTTHIPELSSQTFCVQWLCITIDFGNFIEVSITDGFSTCPMANLSHVYTYIENNLYEATTYRLVEHGNGQKLNHNLVVINGLNYTHFNVTLQVNLRLIWEPKCFQDIM